MRFRDLKTGDLNFESGKGHAIGLKGSAEREVQGKSVRMMEGPEGEHW